MFIEADYAQIELRLIQYFSEDSALKTAIHSGDAHLYIASLVDKLTGMHKLETHNWPFLHQLYKDRNPQVEAARQENKAVFYGWGYGMGAKKVEHEYGVPFVRAKAALLALNKTFSGVVAWWDELELCARHNRLLRNPFGRIRRFLDVPEEVTKIRNFLPTSTAADILFAAMRRINKALGRGEQLVLTVHDQVLVRIDMDCVLTYQEEYIDAVVKELRKCMEQPVAALDGLVIPVDIAVGKNWGKRSESNPDGLQEVS